MSKRISFLLSALIIFLFIITGVAFGATATFNKTFVDYTNGCITVTWSGFSGNVNVLLYKGTTTKVTPDVWDNAPPSGNVDICTPPWEIRCDYRVKVELRSNPSIYEWAQLNGDYDFCVGSLTVTYPNGGQTLYRGQNYTITWNSNNVTDNIQIDLYNPPPTNNVLQLAAGTPNTGSYPFNIACDFPYTGSGYSIGISNARSDQNDGQVWDFSDNTFSIQSPSAPSIPTAVSAVYQSNNNWNYITWNAVTGATSYKVYWGTNPGVTTSSNVMPPTSSTDYTHTGVDAGYCYYYRVAAVGQCNIESFLSTEVSACVPSNTLPDLTSSASVGCKYTLGQTNVQIPVTVRRSEGSLTSGTYVHAKLYWSTNDTQDTGDTVLWSSNDSTPDFPNSVLNSNGTKTVTATINIPAASSGTYYIISYADAPQPNYPNGYHTESDETNNATAYQVTIPEANQLPSLVPLYRLYKGDPDYDHFYTTCVNEKDKAVTKDGYKYEKIEAYIYDASVQGAVPLYRLYNSTTKSHFYTIDEEERQRKKNNEGYQDEGIPGYVYYTWHEYTVPIYHLNHPVVNDHFYTISEFERDNAVNKLLFEDLGIAFFVSRNSANAPLAGKPTAKQSGIDMASGNFQPFYNHVDFANPPGKGIPFVFARTYNAMNAGESGPLGPGWDHSYNIRIIEYTVSSDTFTSIKWGDGRIDTYKLDGTVYNPYCTDINGNPTQFCGIYDTLTKSGSTFILTRKDMTKYTFEIYSTGNGWEHGRLTRIEDRNGNPVVLIYDADGNLNTVREGTEMTARSYMFSYDLAESYACNTSNSTDKFRIAWIMEQDASLNYRNIRFGYDEKCNLVKYWDAENKLTQYEYDEDNLLTKIILPRGNTWTANYDPGGNGRIINHTVDKEKTVFTYNDQDNGTIADTYSIANPDSPALLQTNSCAHSNFKLQSCKDGLYKTSKIIAYDIPTNPNLPTQVEDKNGKIWAYTYNSKGNVLTSTTPYPRNETTTYEYDLPTGLYLIKVTDPEGNITRYEYDAKGNLWKIINVDKVNGIDYDRITRIERYNTSDLPEWNGLVKSVTYPRNNTTTYEYDDRGYQSRIIDPLNKITQFTYDAGGRLLSKTDADNVTTTYTYDNMNRVKTVKDHQLKTTTYNYDANGNLESVDDPRPAINEKIFSYNNRDLLETARESNILVATKGYDDIGRLTSIKNASNQTWRMNYDMADNLINVITPLDFTDSYPEYDGNGNLKRFSDRINRTITYDYDDASRLLNQTILNGVQYTFDYYKNNQLKSASKPLGSTTSFDYTTRSQIKSYTDSYGKTVDYTYDEAGNLNTITFNGKTVTYNYDQRNLLESVTDWLNRTTWYTYTDAGRLSRITYPNGTYIEYIYDPANPARLQILNNKKSDGTLIAGYAVGTFDALDAPEQITTSGGIESVGQPYDSGSVDYDANNRILNSGSLITFTHNNQGELETKTQNSITTYFDWDANDVPGRLNRIRKDTSTTEFVYDALGNRISATKNGATTRYVLDVSGEMSNVIAETDASGSVKAYYIHGLGLISKILPDGSAKYYHYDMIGNTVALTDNSGNVTDQYAYSIDPYGFSITSQGSTENPFKFVGRYGVMDEGNNIYFMRARYYDAETGRFLNEDPLGFEGGDLDLYVYVNDNPITGIDPEGLFEWWNKIKKASKVATNAVSKAASTVGDIADLVSRYYKSSPSLLKGPDFIPLAKAAPLESISKKISFVGNIYKIGKAAYVPFDLFFSGIYGVNPDTKPSEALELSADTLEIGGALLGAPVVGAINLGHSMIIDSTKMEGETCRSLEYLLKGNFKCPKILKNLR